MTDSIGWCDRCFLVERHRPGARPAEVYYYSAGPHFWSDEYRYELAAPFSDFAIEYFTKMVGEMEGSESRMLLKFENHIAIDFWLRDDEALDMSFGDPGRAFWGLGIVDAQIAASVIKAGAAGGDLRDVLDQTAADITYFAAYQPPADSPDEK